MKQSKTFLQNLLFTFLVMSVICSFADDELDIVNPYEIKVSRSKEADTFYFTQHAVANSSTFKNIDTIRTYDVFLEERMTPFGIAYMCNGSEITKKKYLEYKSFWNASGACKPCLLFTYDNKEQLKYIAYQYEDCLCGLYKEYYPSGELKVEGQFKENTSGNWENLKARNLCSLRDGKWSYFSLDGVLEKTEFYSSGKLIETINPLQTNPSNQKTISTSSETVEKKNIFQKLKDKNKSSEQ